MNSSKSSLFLMELILSILFFSLASAVCVLLFVKSHLINRQSTDMTNAVNLSQDVAEIYTGVLDYDNYLDRNALFDTMCRIINESGVMVYSDTKDNILILKNIGEDSYIVYFRYEGYSADTGLCEARIEVYDSSSALESPSANTSSGVSDTVLMNDGIMGSAIKEGSDNNVPEPIYSLEVNRHLPERME